MGRGAIKGIDDMAKAGSAGAASSNKPPEKIILTPRPHGKGPAVEAEQPSPARLTPEQQVMAAKKLRFLNEFNERMYKELNFLCDVVEGRAENRAGMWEKIGQGIMKMGSKTPDVSGIGMISLAAALIGAGVTILGQKDAAKRLQTLYEEIMRLRQEKGPEAKHSLQTLVHEAGVRLADRYAYQIFYGEKPEILAQTAVAQALEFLGKGKSTDKLTPETIVLGALEGRSGAGSEGFVNQPYPPVAAVTFSRDWHTQGALRRAGFELESKGTRTVLGLGQNSKPSKYGIMHVDEPTVAVYKKQRTVQMVTVYDAEAMRLRQNLPEVTGYKLSAEEITKLGKKAPKTPGWAPQPKPTVKDTALKAVAAKETKKQIDAMLTFLEPRIKDLETRMTALEREVKEMGEAVYKMQEVVAVHEQRIGAVEAGVDSLSADLSGMQVAAYAMSDLGDVIEREAKSARNGNINSWRILHAQADKLGAPFGKKYATGMTALIGACNPWGQRSATAANKGIMADYKGDLDQAVIDTFANKEAIVRELLDALENDVRYKPAEKVAYLNQLAVDGKAKDSALANLVMWGHWELVERALNMGADPVQDIVLGSGDTTNIWSIAVGRARDPYTPDQDCCDLRPGNHIDRWHVLWLIEQKAVEKGILEQADCQFYGTEQAKTFALLHANGQAAERASPSSGRSTSSSGASADSTPPRLLPKAQQLLQGRAALPQQVAATV